MKFMLLIHQGTAPTPRDPEEWNRLSAEEQQAVFADYQAINQTPGVTSGMQLAPPDTATTVRVQDGKTLVPTGRSWRPRRRSAATCTSRPTTSMPRSSWPGGSRRPAWAARSRSARSWSGSDPRTGLPRRVGARRRHPDRPPARLRPRGGGRPGGVRDRRRALAARRRAGEPAGVADHDGAQPRHRPHPPRPDAGRQDARAGPAGGRRGARHGRDPLPRRAARARLHLLPSRPRRRGAGRAHPAHARRPDDGRDRGGVPRRGGDDGAAAGARQAQDQAGRHPVPHPARPPAARPAGRRARRRLPDLQRRLRRPRRPGRRGAAAGARAHRADAGRAGGARPAGDDAAARRPPRRALP